MNVDPVHERAGDLGSIPLDLRNGAIALFGGIAVVTARAGIHGCDQHESGRVGEGCSSA